MPKGVKRKLTDEDPTPVVGVKIDRKKNKSVIMDDDNEVTMVRNGTVRSRRATSAKRHIDFVYDLDRVNKGKSDENNNAQVVQEVVGQKNSKIIQSSQRSRPLKRKENVVKGSSKVKQS